MAIKISVQNYFLEFIHPFKIAAGLRTHTPSVFIKIDDDGVVGYGEATLPPYLKETQQTVKKYLDIFFSKKYEGIDQVYNDALVECQNPNANMPALAAIEMACLQIMAFKSNKTIPQLLNIPSNSLPLCTFTVGMDTIAVIEKKLEEAKNFEIIKIKLGGENDMEIVEAVCGLTQKRICVDANQGWNSFEKAESMLARLAGYPLEFIEQPMPKANFNDMKRLKSISKVPLIADESFQTIDELNKIAEAFDGINIKLMKCGGITEAKKIIDNARVLNLKILIGCMSESSCGVAAATNLSQLADWVDLDGPLLIKNDPFTGVEYKGGRIMINPGGAQLKRNALWA